MNSLEDKFQQAQLAEATYANFSVTGVKDALQDVNNGGAFSNAQAEAFVAQWTVVDQYTAPGLTGSGFSATVFQNKETGQHTFAIRGTEANKVSDLSADIFGIGAKGIALRQALDLYNYRKSLDTSVGQAYLAAYLKADPVETALLTPFWSAAQLSQAGLTAYNVFRIGLESRGFWVDGATVSALAVGSSTTVASDGLEFGRRSATTGLGANYEVVGHSLGGHLAMVLGRLDGSNVASVETFNPAYFDPLISNKYSEQFFKQLQQLELTTFGVSEILDDFKASQNYEVAGDLVHHIGSQKPGKSNRVFTETQDSGPISAHNISAITDSLAIYSLFAKLDASLTASSPGAIPSLLEASSNVPVNTLEGALAALGKLFGITYSAVETTRDDFYVNLLDLQKNNLFKSLIGNVKIELATADLDSRAKNDFSALVSLITLSPIVLTGSSALLESALGAAWSAELSQWQADVMLTPEQGDAGQANFSDQYLGDRATMLAWMIQGNQQDALSNDQAMFVSATQLGVSDIWQFTDVANGRSIFVSPAVPQGRHDVYFGNEEDNSFTGSMREDTLYGGEGNDTLDGSNGADYLEGNADNDYLKGGKGRDTLFGGTGNDVLAGGEENDILNGGFGDDTYSFANGDGWDWIDDQDGSGHIEYEGVTLGKSALNHVRDNVWQEKIGVNTFTYSLYTRTEETETYPYLSIQGLDGGMWVKRWQAGRFGIALPEPPAAEIIPIATPAIAIRETSWHEPDHAVINASDLSGVEVHAVGNYGEVTGNGKIVGNDQDNRLIGGGSDDWLTGNAGRDTLVANGGNDKLDGGDDDDAISAGNGNDLLEGGRGSDVLSGGQGSDILNGGDGDDYLFGGGDYTAVRSDWSTAPASTPSGIIPFNQFSGTASLADDGADLLDGGAGNDRLWGGEGGDQLDGGKGNDQLVGDSEDDYLIGGEGDDNLFGDGAESADVAYFTLPAYHGNDILDGAAGNDTLSGDGGSDDLYGGDGNDILIGDAKGVPIEYHGEDLLDGGAGNDSLYGDGNDDRLFGGSGDDKLEGDSSYVASADQGDDYLDGQEGNDDLAGNGGNDTLFGGAGDDLLYGDTDDTPVENQGDDKLNGQDGDDYLRGYAGNDVLFGGSGDDQLESESGNDALEGNSGEDTLFAGEGDDSLNGGTGTDYIDGGAGDDTYLFAAGDSPINKYGQYEGIVDVNGNNTVAFENAVARNLTLSSAYGGEYLIIGYGPGDRLLVQDGFAGAMSTYEFADGERLSFTELIGRRFVGAVDSTTGAGRHVLVGGRNDNRIVGSAGGSLFSGGRGNDTLTGDGGGNTYLYSASDGSDTIADNSKANGFMAANTLRFGTGITSAGITSADITLGVGSLLIRVGNDPANTIHIEGFNAGDVFAQNTIDRFEFADGSVLSYAQLLERGFDLAGSAGDEVLSGTNIGDRIDGMGGDDILRGGAGDDTVFGGSGDDELVGGVGNDWLDGGAGNDIYVVERGSGHDTISEAPESSADKNNIMRFAADIRTTDIAFARDESNLIVGIENSGDTVTVRNFFLDDTPSNPQNPIQRIEFFDQTIWNIDDIVGRLSNSPPTGTLTLSGDASEDQVLYAENTLADADGLGAIDYQWQSLIDGIDWNAISDATASSFTLGEAQVGHRIRVTASYIDGHGTAESVVSAATTAVANVNDAPTGAVTLAGSATQQQTLTAANTLADADGLGAIAYQWQSSADGSRWDDIAGATAESLTLGEAQVGRQIRVAASYTDGHGTPESQFSSATAAVAKAADALVITTGGRGNDTLSGLSGDDRLDGKGGNDTLIGGAGDDTLIGGTGSDALYGGSGDDTLQFAADGKWSSAHAAYNVGSPGQSGSGERFAIAGRARLFDLVDGGDGDDLLQGSSGNDAIFLDDGFSPLPGTMGARIVSVETIRAGDGDDVVDLTSDRYAYGNVLLAGGNGNDVLWASAGSDVIEGGAGADRLYGGAGSDLLAGGAGADFIDGARGADLLIGGAGNDTIITGDDLVAFNPSDGFDVVNMGTGSAALSLGGGIAYADLALRKNGNDLVLDTGNGDGMSFKNWYLGADKHYALKPLGKVLKLQVIAEAMADFAPGGADPLRDDKIEAFDFAGLVGAFDAARAATPTLSSWALADALTQFHLAGSDAAALGGDLAYQYGKNGTLAGIGVTAAQQVLGEAAFGGQAQTLKPLAGLQVGTQRLA